MEKRTKVDLTAEVSLVGRNQQEIGEGARMVCAAKH